MDDLVNAILGSGKRIAIACAGGGSGAIAALAKTPGASRALLDARVPYSQAAMTEYLGRKPRTFCSAEASADLALRALSGARAFSGGNEQGLLGVGVAACLATVRARRGDEQCFVSVVGVGVEINRRIVFEKGARDRPGQEDVVDSLVLDCLAEACGLEQRPLLSLRDAEELQEFTLGLDFWLARLERGEIAWFRRGPEGETSPFAAVPTALLSGAFNPLHKGHRRLAQAAGRNLGARIDFEVSILNVDKPAIAASEIRRRLAQFDSVGNVFVTRAPTFLDKARLFPGCAFVVGADTAPRVVAPEYYGGSIDQMGAALAEIARLACRFLVAGRVDDAGRFVTLASLKIPAKHRPLFSPLAPDEFREDISSTELRSRR